MKDKFDPKVAEIQEGHDQLSISLEYEDNPTETHPMILYVPNPDHDRHYHISLSDSAVVKLHKWLDEYLKSK